MLLVSCKTTKSTIITSKKEAIKKKQYDYNLPNRVANTENKTTPKKVEVVKKEPQKKIVLECNDEENKVVTTDNANRFCKQLIENALENLGSPYVSGGTSKSGFDCSGLMFTTFKNFDIILPRTSNEMSRIGRILEREEIRKGDLIFFKTNGRSQINHVGMVIEVTDDEIKFVHSSTHKGVITSSTKEPYYNKTFAQVNRVIE